MTTWRVPLADVIVPESDIAAVADVYRSGSRSMGPERGVRSRVRCLHRCRPCSGRGQWHGCCAPHLPRDRPWPRRRGDLPSLTFVASANAVAYTGATPVFADIAGLAEPWLSAAVVEAAITPRTRAEGSVIRRPPWRDPQPRRPRPGPRPGPPRGRRARRRRARRRPPRRNVRARRRVFVLCEQESRDR